IAAVDDPANSTTFYPVNLTNSSGAAPLPPALLGNSLTVNGGAITITTEVDLPGGTFTATANGSTVDANRSVIGNGISVGAGGVVDVSGRVQQFVDVLASIGGGDINLTSAKGAISVQSGAVLNVGDLAGIFSLNKTSAGTLNLSAPKGDVTVAVG